MKWICALDVICIERNEDKKKCVKYKIYMNFITTREFKIVARIDICAVFVTILICFSSVFFFVGMQTFHLESIKFFWIISFRPNWNNKRFDVLTPFHWKETFVCGRFSSLLQCNIRKFMTNWSKMRNFVYDITFSCEDKASKYDYTRDVK